MGTELKVGVFTAVALGTLLTMFFVIDPEIFDTTEYVQYKTILKDADGIVSKSHVKTNGVSVGKVLTVELKDNQTELTLELEETVKIPVGSKIEKRSTGLLGDMHIEIIRPPSAERGRLKPGDLIPEAEDSNTIQSLMNKAGDIGNDIKKITEVLAKVLGSEEGEQNLSAIVKNIRTVTEDLKKTTATIREVIGERDKDLHDIVTNVRDGVADLREFSASLKDVMDEENRQRIDRILASFDETMEDVKGSAKNINLISERVEKGEGTIGKLINDDSAIAELEGAIKDIRKVLAPATKLRVAVDFRMEAREDESTQQYFNVVLRTRPDRYYLLGVTDGESDVVETKSEVLEDSDGDSSDGTTNPNNTTRKTITTEKALKFNLQMAKRWHFVALRFGLFESKGGLAADFYLLKDRFRFSIEAFDWDTQNKTVRRTAHLKLYASILFYNHVNVLAGVDDITRTDPDTGDADKDLNYFLGAGLTFNDDDLKALFGIGALAL